MYLCVIAFPLLNYLIINLFGRFLGTYICAILSAVSVFLTFLFALFIFYEVAICNSICEVHLASWFSGELLSTNWAFNFDTLTAVMLVVVSSISSFVHFYSIEYMNSDPHQTRFLSYLSLFTFFMLILALFHWGSRHCIFFVCWLMWGPGAPSTTGISRLGG